MGAVTTIARRTFLLGSVAVTGGVAIGYWAYNAPLPNPMAGRLKKGENALNPYVVIDQTGVTVITPRAEMGQGVQSTLAALVAEELDLDWNDIRIEHGPASKTYYNGALLAEGAPVTPYDESERAERLRSFMGVPARFLGMQITGGSSSMVDGYEKMRKAGAAARTVLIGAAAARLGVAEGELRTENGAVIAPDGQRIAYGELAEDAATIPPPADPALRPRSEWKLLGTSLPRLDMVGKSTGTATYALDVQLPGMLYATVRMNPNLEAPLRSYDAAAAETMPGVKKIFPLDTGVAVVATNTWYAFKAAGAVECDWENATYPANSAAMYEVAANSFTEAHFDNQMRDEGDVDAVLADGDVIEAEYRAPYLAHATMEPMNAVAWLRDGKLDVWAGAQAPTLARMQVAQVTSLDEDNIEIHTTLMGGGFGRRAENDFIMQAAKIAVQMEGTPIKMTWSREEDMCHDFYRPLAIARLRATVSNGKPAAVDLSVAASSVMQSQMTDRGGITVPGPDATIVQAAWDQPYQVDNYRVTGYRVPMMLPVSSWRSVGGSQNGFFHESAMDELAHAAGADPLEMRLSLIEHEPSRRVLEAVREMSDWGSPLPEGHGRGVAFSLTFGVPTAEVMEVAVTDNGIRIIKAIAAVDVGVALDPRNIEAQVVSGINYGLAAAMLGEITVDQGAVVQTNFHNYDAIRMYQSPHIEVRVLEHGKHIKGIGEPGTPPAAPALANAIFAATGERIRELPLKKHIRFA